MQVGPEALWAHRGASLTCQGYLTCAVTTGRVLAFLPINNIITKEFLNKETVHSHLRIVT